MSGETGIANVTVEVYVDTNANGTYDAGTDTLADTATTDTNGVWTVTDLFPEDYIGCDSSFAIPGGWTTFQHGQLHGQSRSG